VKDPRRERWLSGFTLLEIVVVLVIVAVLAGFAVPFISGMMREAAMRAPVEELQDLAKIVRLRAITEQRPYEIVFTQEGFFGQTYKFYVTDGEPEVEKEEPAADGEETPKPTEDDETSAETPANADEAEAEKQLPPPGLVDYRFAPEMTVRLLYWGRSQWVEPLPEGERAKAGQGRWVFQPSGLCNPLRVHFRKGNAWIEIAFNPLTADVQDEHHYFPE